ncbi:carbohydrate ABC transporter permease [Tumebacillus flagellatus]|uniref:ABC transporter permease n=1 Tax=Tumebacillus flagellatus TaxID=1157490 RepID=A0A074LKM9_9BACL|nr:carbohydrate ABC transporter permease [Tumebacillus flagellatus]KEO81649.1 ABC transporter permease [Tumebacillus flagellatus]
MKTSKFWHFIANLATWLLVLGVVFPIVWMVFTALHTRDEILGGINTLTFTPQWHNFVDMWKNIDFLGYFKNSLIICGFTMVFACTFALFGGYALAKYRFPGAGLFSTAVISTQMIPGIMFLIPIYLMFLWINKTIHLPMVNTYWGMILVYTAFYTPMSIFIMRSFFVSIPKELEESAIVDGCNRFQAFLRIILPLAVPGMVATCVFIFLTAWDELMFAWVLTTTSDVQTIPVGIRLFVGQFGTQNRYDLLMAAATVVTVPVMLVFFLCQKYFIRGMTAGAVKG